MAGKKSRKDGTHVMTWRVRASIHFKGLGAFEPRSYQTAGPCFIRVHVSGLFCVGALWQKDAFGVLNYRIRPTRKNW